MREIEETNFSVNKDILENTRGEHFDSDTFSAGSTLIKEQF